MALQRQQRHDPSKNLVGFVVGGVRYAVPIGGVREIANPLPVVSLPRAPEAVCGVADYRGDVVPVVDMRVRFGLPAAAPSRRTKWIVIDVGGRYAALVVDSVTEVFGTSGASLKPAPSLGGGEDTRGISGVAHDEEGLIFVLDTTAFESLTDPLVRLGSLSPPARASLLPGSGTT